MDGKIIVGVDIVWKIIVNLNLNMKIIVMIDLNRMVDKALDVVLKVLAVTAKLDKKY